MKLKNKLYRTILNFPETEMTVTQIIQALDSDVNPQTVRVTVCNMAAETLFIEKTGRRKGREMIYKKCRDIQSQWQLMNKTPSGKRRAPSPAASSRSITRQGKSMVHPRPETHPMKPRRKPVNGSSLDSIFQLFKDLSLALESLGDLESIESRLVRLEQAVQKNEALIKSLGCEPITSP